MEDSQQEEKDHLVMILCKIHQMTFLSGGSSIIVIPLFIKEEHILPK